jgi:transcription elongation factor GreA
MTISKPHLITAEGLKKLSDELDYLSTDAREAIADRLHSAFQDGQDDDFVENAELEAARNELSFLEGRIQDLQDILNNYQIIEESSDPHDDVQVGDWVTVVEEGFDEDERYHLVGPAEADPASGRISVESPLGKALLGAKPGDSVRVNAPNGILSFKIVSMG